MLKRAINTIMILSILFTAMVLGGCAGPRAYDRGKALYANKHYHQAFEQFFYAAGAGDLNAQYAIGYMYFYGIGTRKNSSLGLKWIVYAAHYHQPQAVKAIRMFTQPTIHLPVFDGLF